jgi:hypothetical protein
MVWPNGHHDSFPSPSCRLASLRRSSMAPRLRTSRSPASPRPARFVGRAGPARVLAESRADGKGAALRHRQGDFSGLPFRRSRELLHIRPYSSQLGRSNTVNRVEDPDGEGRQLRLRSERTLTPSILVRIQVSQPHNIPILRCITAGRKTSLRPGRSGSSAIRPAQQPRKRWTCVARPAH